MIIVLIIMPNQYKTITTAQRTLHMKTRLLKDKKLIKIETMMDEKISENKFLDKRQKFQ